ncbi:polysaccharide biosynthesis protein CapD [Methanococcus maripaludis C5]|uniref:Polysaccharide biosynthesis protein CapD n=2 Tax=Methanococcus maripaludis TaxID=39152 RepID=A4FX86_METM5|nr:polysaccharide biosynthesis protein CapD [Methanococcus maripaludis C5]
MEKTFDELMKFYENKKILVTGGTGSIGSTLVKSLLKLNPDTVRIFDINETALFDLEHELNDNRIRCLIGDVRDKERVYRAVEDIDIVFHAAALKHVPLCEYNPFEAVKTNVLGTQNLIDAAIDENIEKFITISTDKAVNPVNVMGATKLLSERLTLSANLYKGSRTTVFSAVRFGNVLNSRGSIIPLIKGQIRKGGPVTLTDSEMTRFVMKIDQAVHLVLKAGLLAQDGEIFVLKMPSVKIIDLIEFLIEKYAPEHNYQKEDIEIKNIGKRAGEKLYEELLMDEECSKLEETDEMYIIKPFKSEKSENVKKVYNSENVGYLRKEDLEKLL